MRRKKHNRKSNQMGNSFEEQNLPLGYVEFETIRSDNSIYVDKTELIFQICNVTRQVLLVRPRRFGKTLLVSTFASLFSHGTRDFQGLAIERLWNDKTYPVIRLDFSGLKSSTDQRNFVQRCTAIFSRALHRWVFRLIDKVRFCFGINSKPGSKNWKRAALFFLLTSTIRRLQS